MSADRDLHRVIRSWLHEDRHEDAEPVLDTVLAQLDTIPQRRSPWPAWRTPIMNNTVRLIATAAAVVVAALIGYQVLIAPNVGGPGPLPTESPSAAPTATPAPSEGTGNLFPPTGSLEVGTRYAVSAGAPFSGAVSYSFSVPTSSWRSDGVIGIHLGGQPTQLQLVEASVWFFDNYGMFENDGQVPMIPAVLDDPCVHDGLQSQSFEASLAGQAEAIASIPGTELVSGPSDVTVDSRPGQEVTIALPANPGCARQEFWFLFNQSEGPGEFYPNWQGETLHAWLIDVDGEIFTIWVQVPPGDVRPDLDGEIQQIVDSIQFE